MVNHSLQFHNSSFRARNIQIFAINLQIVWYHSFFLFLFQFFLSGRVLIKLLTNFDNLSLQFHNSNSLSNIQVFAINLQFVWYHSFLLFFFPLGRDLITIPSPLQFLRVITTVVNLVSRHDLKSHRILLGTGSKRHFFFVNVF